MGTKGRHYRTIDQTWSGCRECGLLGRIHRWIPHGLSPRKRSFRAG